MRIQCGIFSGDGEIGCRGSKKTGIVARDLKSRKKEFLNRYTRRIWNLRVRYVIASKGTEGCKMISPHHSHPTNGVGPSNFMGSDPRISIVRSITS